MSESKNIPVNIFFMVGSALILFLLWKGKDIATYDNLDFTIAGICVLVLVLNVVFLIKKLKRTIKNGIPETTIPETIKEGRKMNFEEKKQEEKEEKKEVVQEGGHPKGGAYHEVLPDVELKGEEKKEVAGFDSFLQTEVNIEEKGLGILRDVKSLVSKFDISIDKSEDSLEKQYEEMKKLKEEIDESVEKLYDEYRKLSQQIEVVGKMLAVKKSISPPPEKD